MFLKTLALPEVLKELLGVGRLRRCVPQNERDGEDHERVPNICIFGIHILLCFHSPGDKS